MDSKHQELLNDLIQLLDNANDYHYHDKKSPFPEPKRLLEKHLQEILDKSKNHKYDNK